MKHLKLILFAHLALVLVIARPVPDRDLQEALNRQVPGPSGADNLWDEDDDEELVELEDCMIFEEYLSRPATIALLQRALLLLETPQKTRGGCKIKTVMQLV